MNKHLEKAIADYAHDFRDMAMDEVSLANMLREFYQAVEDAELNEMAEGMYADAVKRGEIKDMPGFEGTMEKLETLTNQH